MNQKNYLIRYKIVIYYLRLALKGVSQNYISIKILWVLPSPKGRPKEFSFPKDNRICKNGIYPH